MANNRDIKRIPQTVIDDLIEQNDIVDIIGSFLKLKLQGKDYVALCPFHNESSPSFTVSPIKQFFYCFGCGEGGNAMNFLQKYQGRSFLSVLQDMADRANVDLTPYMKMTEKDQVAYQILPAMSRAAKYFEGELHKPSPKAKQASDYLLSRKIPESIIKSFGLGLAGFGGRIAEELADDKEALIEAGVLDSKDDRVFSLFWDRVVMPIRDMRGKVIGVSGRALDEATKPKYKNSKETPHFSRNNILYGLYESHKLAGTDKIQRLSVVEGQFDVMASHIIGEAAGASLGSSVSVQQLRLMLRYAENVVFVFDGDAAGLKALHQVGCLLLENLSGHETSFSVAILPTAEDPHSLITKDPKQYRSLLDSSEYWLTAFLRMLPQAQDLSSDKGRAEFAATAVDIAHTARDPLIRYQTIEKAAFMANMPVSALAERLESFPAPRSGQARTDRQILNDAAVRLSRMLWDEPSWSEAIEYPQLWIDEGDSLVGVLGLWRIDLAKGLYDATLTDEEQQAISLNPKSESELLSKRRERGGASALGRMLSELPQNILHSIMQDAPDNDKNLAIGLIWHITGLCAAKAMKRLSDKAASGSMSKEDRESFPKLMNIRNQAAKRTRTIFD